MLDDIDIVLIYSGGAWVTLGSALLTKKGWSVCGDGFGGADRFDELTDSVLG